MMQIKRLFKLFVAGLIVLFSQTSIAGNYDPVLLKAQAALFPKIAVLDKEITQKLDQSNRIELAIVYQRMDIQTAENLKNWIEKKYQGRLAKFDLHVKLVEFDKVKSHSLSSAYYVLNAPNASMAALSDWLASRHRMLFSYDYRAFEQRSLVSLLLKEKTYIYLNKAALSQYNVKFQSLFYRIAKVFE